MTITESEALWCAVGKPTSRRFYIHERSFGSLLSAQPTFRRDLTQALVLSAGSRGAEQRVEDWTMFSTGIVDESIVRAAHDMHRQAAAALQSAFQCLVHLVPARFGETELLLGTHEQINSWCYEDGYFTYATDEVASRVMYAETGSLRELRSRIRRTPDFDPSLQMISGPSLFLVDAGTRTGAGTAAAYRRQHTRQLRKPEAAGSDLDFGLQDAAEEFAKVLDQVTDRNAAADMLARCVRGASMTLDVLRKSRAVR